MFDLCRIFLQIQSRLHLARKISKEGFVTFNAVPYTFSWIKYV